MAQRERRGAQGNGSAPGRTGPRGREGRGAREGENNWRRQVGPSGHREGGGKRAGQKLPLIGDAHLSGGASARARGLPGLAGLLCLFLVLWIF
jgi:hypothetical protein